MIRFRKLKKLAAVMLVIIMSVGFMSGCGNNQEAVDNVVTVITDDETSETVTNETVVEEPQEVAPPQEDTTTEEAYTFYAFMNGDGLVEDKRAKGILTVGARYNFQQMTEAIQEYVMIENEIEYLGDISYSFIDCGADGKQELALKFEFCREENQGYGDYIQYIIISADGDALKVIYDDYTFYRSETTISDTGYVRRGGSDSAMASSFDTLFINEKGEEVFIYTEECTLGLASPVIPSYYLAQSQIPENYEDSDFTDDLAYSVTRFNFNSFTADKDIDEAKYDAYKKKNFYSFADSEGNDIDKADYDAALYEDMKVEIIDYSEAFTRIKEQEVKCGVTAAIREGKDIIWYPFDKVGAFKEYRYKNAVSANKSSVEEQLKLIASTEHIWRNDKADKANSYVYYAVTDLDKNGRLEIIRSDYCYLPEFCKNRFYEVTPDFKNVVKMEYDVETMWGEDEESGSSHGLVNVNLPIYCFWNSQYGKDAPGYTGITYYYIIPTREVHDGYESIVKMSLCANNSGRVFTDFVGYANMNSETGEVSYMDYNGFDTSEEEFAKAEFSAYSADTGWECDKVNWSFVTLTEDEDVLECLTKSYNDYSHETIIRLY